MRANLDVLRRSFTTGAWLGWKIESNWTDPFLFFIYSFAKPVSAALILVVMYGVISRGAFGTPMFAYLYIGNAFYQFVASTITGTSWAVADDREHYRTLKYIYTAPVSIIAYLWGRGAARFITTTFSVAATLLLGWLFLQVPFDLAHTDWLMFAAAMLVGLLMLSMIGLILGGCSLLLARQDIPIGEAVAGGLYLFSGAIFPLETLPAWLRPVGYAVPVSYWLELLRRSLGAGSAQAFPTFAALTSLDLLLILCGLTLVISAAALWIFSLCDRQAREQGLIDMTSNY